MPREKFDCYYNEKTKLYRKRLKDASGKYISIYDRSKSELEKKYKQAQKDIELNINIKDNITFAEYAKRWYALNTNGLSFARQKDYRMSINKHIAPKIGHMQIKDIQPDDLKQILFDMKDMSKSAQSKVVISLKKIFAAAKENKLILDSPCLSLKAGGYKPDEKIPLNNKQAETLLEAAKETSAYTFIMLGLYTGMRCEEILGLCWDCVFLNDTPYISVSRALTFKDNSIPIVSDKLKSKAAYRNIPIPKILVEYLKEITHNSDFVICNAKGDKYSYNSFRNMWRLIDRRKVQGNEKIGSYSKYSPHVKRTIDFHVTPHILRHTYITNLILAGVNIKVVQYLAGHSDIKTTLNIYTHVIENTPKNLIGDIEKAFSGYISGQNKVDDVEINEKTDDI